MKLEIPMMPESYKGKYIKICNRNGRKWTDEEFEWTRNLLNKGFNKNQIAVSIDRSVTGASSIIKHIRKQDNTYNKSHCNKKYETNIKFIERIKPKNVLDLYCGVNNFYKGKIKNVTSNDKDKTIIADYNMAADKCIAYLYSQNKKYDLIDLDPYGSAYDCFDLAIKMAKKGIIITLGEMDCKRWKNERFIKRYYNMSLEDFTLENIINHIKMIGMRNNKKINPVFIEEWKNIARVWFEIENV